MIYHFLWSRSAAASGNGSHSASGRPFGRSLLVPPLSRLTIAARVIAIVLTLAVPLNLVILAVIWHLSEAAIETQRISLLYTARSVAAAADAKLGKYMTLAKALAASPAVLEDNLDAFEAEARRIFASTPEAWAMLADLAGQQLVNTAPHARLPLPVRNPTGLAAQRRAFETRSAFITGVRYGKVSESWIVNFEVPIFKDGEPHRALSVAVKAQSFFRLLNDHHIPKNWLAAIVDGQGRFIARVPGNGRYEGQPISESWHKVKDRDGVFETVTLEGDCVVDANAHSPASGWLIGIAVKKAEMQAAAWDAVRWAAILGGGFSVLSLLLAGVIARSITRPIEELRRRAPVLLTEPEPIMPLRGPPEVRELYQALKQTAAKHDRSSQALRESEERFRGIYEHAGTGIAIADLEGRFQSCNPAYSKMLGYSQEELRELTPADIQHPDDRDINREEVRRLVEEKIPSFEIVNRYLGKDGKCIWVHKHVSLLRDASGRPTHRIGLTTDITERKRQEDQITLLMREVNHRSKNMLTLVQAIARQTLAANPQDFLDRFERRIEALAGGQDLLVKNAWMGAGLDELIRTHLAPFEDLIGTRILLQGQDLFVTAHAAQAIGMALHELATNAGKYGALSRAGGRVELAWGLQRGELDGMMFVMTWREQGAHPVRAPAKLGFGSTVICELAEMSLGAKVELSFPATGLTWQIRCAAEEVVEGSPSLGPGLAERI